MLEKLTAILLSGIICLSGITLALAELRMPSPMQYTTVEEYEKATGKKITKFNEAPMLRVKVAAGELPPVEKRLPEEPLVIVPVEEIGRYGGTWHRAWLGPADKWGPEKVTAEGLLRYSPDGTKVLPNLVKSWKVSDDARVFTFYLRKGVKWSDGVPFTADDILFYYEDELLNKELTPVLGKDWRPVEEGGMGGKVEKVDDYTVRFTFEKPYGLFLINCAYSYRLFYDPKHYLKQFHPRYTPLDKLEKMAKEAGFTYWYELFHSKADSGWWDENPDHPTLRAWKVTVPSPATRMVMERNPYYWKVDPEGNQLPYIDRIIHDTVSDIEMINFKAMTGEIDMQQRHILNQNYTLFMKNKGEGDYRVVKWTAGVGADPLIMININCPDPVLRKIFENDKFRKALSLAINREEINELCYLGMGEPRQASIISGAPYFSEEWEKAYAEYDPEKANALLDEMGLTNRDREGFRLRPDGKTLAVTIEFTPAFGAWADALELIKEYWKAVGIKVAIKSEERSLLWKRTQANEHEISVWYMDRQAAWLAAPQWIVPVGVAHCYWAPEYGRWYATEGKAGERPTGDVAKLQEIYDKIKVTADEKEREHLAKEIIKLHIKNLWLIGTVGELPRVVVVKNNFRNVPEKLIQDDPLRTPGNANPQQFFFKQK